MACTQHILSIAILIYCQLMLMAQGQDCAIQYTEQPPVSLGCQPYDVLLGSFINVRFACTAEADQESQGMLNLTWFQQTPAGHITELGCSIVATRQDGLRQRCLLDIRGDNVPPANYWCQALYRTPSGTSKPLLRSNVITIGTSDQHNGTLCTTTQSIDAVKCAVPAIVITENVNSTDNRNSTEPSSTCSCSTNTSLPSPTSSSTSANNLINSTTSTAPTNSMVTSTPIVSVHADGYHSLCNSNLPESPQSATLPQLTIIIIAVITPALVLLLITVTITCTCLYHYRRQLARLQRKSKKVHATVEITVPDDLEASNNTINNTPPSMPKYINPNPSPYIQPNGSYEYLPGLPDGLRTEAGTNSRYQMLQLGTMDYTNIYTTIVSSGESSRGPSPTQTKQQEAVEEAVYMNMNTHLSIKQKPTYKV